MQDLSANLQKLLKETGINVSELARRINVHQPVLYKIFNNQTANPTVKTLNPIANFFGVSIDQLIGNEPLPIERLAGTYNPTQHGYVEVPLLYWTDILTWIKNSEVKKRDFILTKKDMSRTAFALYVKESRSEISDSVFTQDTILIIEPHCEPQNRDYVMVHNTKDNTVVLRQLFVDSKKYYLKPLNNTLNTEPMSPSEKIVGTVIQSRVDYKNN